MKKIKKLNQNNAPVYEALEKVRSSSMIPFDVPGHKRGKGNQELADFLGERCLSVDVNSMKALDNLCHPTSVIREGEQLAAQAFGAKSSFFMVNGTTSAIQAMVMSAVKKGDKIILPRNVHKSVMNALVLCGGIPVYINPKIEKTLGIALGMSVDAVKRAIAENPDAKAVLVNNPTYYGICSNLKEITKVAHKQNMLVLVDEAHGAHFYFGENLPISAMAAGADMSAVSMHKSGGSLTQSSFLLCGRNINPDYVRQVINLTQTTSGSYLLISSLDIARKNLALNGKEIFKRVSDFAQAARERINAIDGYYAYARELQNGDSVYDFDVTKLVIHTLDTGLGGMEVYDLLRDDYNIQTEFGDFGNLLAYISVGDNWQNIEHLIIALKDIQMRGGAQMSGQSNGKRYIGKSKANLYVGDLKQREEKSGTERLSGMGPKEKSKYIPKYVDPQVILSPQEAFYAEKVNVELKDSEDRISSEFVMCYPPGIPILSPGERISKGIIDYISYARKMGCFLMGTEDMEVNRINVCKGDAMRCGIKIYNPLSVVIKNTEKLG